MSQVFPFFICEIDFTFPTEKPGTRIERVAGAYYYSKIKKINFPVAYYYIYPG